MNQSYPNNKSWSRKRFMLFAKSSQGLQRLEEGKVLSSQDNSKSKKIMIPLNDCLKIWSPSPSLIEVKATIPNHFPFPFILQSNLLSSNFPLPLSFLSNFSLLSNCFLSLSSFQFLSLSLSLLSNFSLSLFFPISLSLSLLSNFSLSLFFPIFPPLKIVQIKLKNLKERITNPILVVPIYRSIQGRVRNTFWRWMEGRKN